MRPQPSCFRSLSSFFPLCPTSPSSKMVFNTRYRMSVGLASGVLRLGAAGDNGSGTGPMPSGALCQIPGGTQNHWLPGPVVGPTSPPAGVSQVPISSFCAVPSILPFSVRFSPKKRKVPPERPKSFICPAILVSYRSPSPQLSSCLRSTFETSILLKVPIYKWFWGRGPLFPKPSRWYGLSD